MAINGDNQSATQSEKKISLVSSSFIITTVVIFTAIHKYHLLFTSGARAG